MAKRKSRKGEKKRSRARKRTAALTPANTKTVRKQAAPAIIPPVPMHPRKRITRRAAEVLPRRALRPEARSAQTIYDCDLDRNAANFQPLTPLSFLERAALVFPDHPAIVHGKRRFTYSDFYTRSRRLASALAERGIGRSDTVAVMLANTPEILEAHYGVPMTGAVLCGLNTRLDPAALAFILDHGEAKVLITDREFAATTKETLKHAKVRPLVIDVDDTEFPQTGERLGTIDYEDFLARGDPA